MNGGETPFFIRKFAILSEDTIYFTANCIAIRIFLDSVFCIIDLPKLNSYSSLREIVSKITKNPRKPRKKSCSGCNEIVFLPIKYHMFATFTNFDLLYQVYAMYRVVFVLKNIYALSEALKGCIALSPMLRQLQKLVTMIIFCH